MHKSGSRKTSSTEQLNKNQVDLDFIFPITKEREKQMSIFNPTKLQYSFTEA